MINPISTLIYKTSVNSEQLPLKFILRACIVAQVLYPNIYQQLITTIDMSNLHQQPKVNVVRAGKPVVATVEEQMTEMDWEDSFIDRFSVNPSNVFPSSFSLSIKRKRGQEDQQDDSEPSEKRVRIKEDGHKFRFPVTLSWSDRDSKACTKELNVLVDTGSEITIINTRMV